MHEHLGEDLPQLAQYWAELSERDAGSVSEGRPLDLKRWEKVRGQEEERDRKRGKKKEAE